MCFDFNYECTSCCSTGLAKNGAPCWDATYTVSRCCMSGTAAAPVFSVQVAAPSFVPPVSAPSYTAPVAAAVPLSSTTTVGQCAKDSSCFDAIYECSGCCSTGIAKNGAPCWDAVYTISRCCASSGAVTQPAASVSTPAFAQPMYSAPVVTPPAFTPAVASTAQCAKDSSCFDFNYECTSCCSTGLAKNGAPCWDATYTVSRCCASSAAAAPVAALSMSGSCSDTLSICSSLVDAGECASVSAPWMQTVCCASCQAEAAGRRRGSDEAAQQHGQGRNGQRGKKGHGAKNSIFIAVGGTAAGLALIAAITFVVVRRRRQSTAAQDCQNESTAARAV